jgi:hypothetical protein
METYPVDQLLTAPIGLIILIFLLGGGTIYGAIKACGLGNLLISSLDGESDTEIPFDQIERWTD